jgi:predicted alpha/beta-fold hydrolase
MAAALVRNGWDVLAWNLRGCGGQPNRLLRMYHSGATEDLRAVIEHALQAHPADAIALIGFSLGGNLTLKYLGEEGTRISGRLHRAVAFSVPCDLACSSRQLARASNRHYMERFLRPMRAKILAKDRMFPGQLDVSGLDRIRSFREFDGRFTAPLHGFRDAADYWERNSCRQFLPQIAVPTLLVNARNDPFLGPGCHPMEEAAASEYFHFEAPETGGHVGFPSVGNGGEYWSETRAVEFLSTRTRASLECGTAKQHGEAGAAGARRSGDGLEQDAPATFPLPSSSGAGPDAVNTAARKSRGGIFAWREP